MAQVLVNFRLDEEDKKGMEEVCRELGMSMSTAFTIFAKKMKREKEIILVARIMSMVFTPFYLPIVGLVALITVVLLYVFLVILPKGEYKGAAEKGFETAGSVTPCVDDQNSSEQLTEEEKTEE